MAAETFSNLYAIGADGRVFTEATGGPFTVTEGVSDGVFDIDAPEQITGNPGTDEYRGTNANGDVAQDTPAGGIDYFLFSNETYANGELVPPLIAADRAVVCFAAGTLIKTASGDVPVEQLQIGDQVITEEGHATLLRWVGRQTLVKSFMRARAQLVRIGAGALGNRADLYVTGDHGMVLDGCVINASALVNGEAISWVPLSDTPERQVVYHVETEAHEVIIANGAASESYLDRPSRALFDNFAEYTALYGAEHPIAENPMPRITSARLLPTEIRRRSAAC